MVRQHTSIRRSFVTAGTVALLLLSGLAATAAPETVPAGDARSVDSLGVGYGMGNVGSMNHQDVYVGTDVDFAAFSDCDPFADSTGAAYAKGECRNANPTYRNAYGEFFTWFTSASAGATLFKEYTVNKRCTSQTPGQTATVVADSDFWGYINQHGGGTTQFRMWVSGNGLSDTKYVDESTVFGEWDVDNSASGSHSFAATFGSTYTATIKHQIEGSTTTFADGRMESSNSLRLDWTDPTAPTVTVSMSSAGSGTDSSGRNWYRNPGTLAISAADSESCPKTIEHKWNGNQMSSFFPGFNENPRNVLFNSNGVYTTESWATNWQGAASNTIPFEFGIDGTKPTTTGTRSCNQNSNGDCVGQATYTFSCSDSHSGCDTTRYRINGGSWQTGTSATVTGNGDYTIEWYSVDLVGNQEQIRSHSGTIVSSCATICPPVEIFIAIDS